VKEQPQKKHILFVSLFGLTELYREISRGLEAEGFRIHWITTNEYWTEYLVADGVARHNILQLIYSPSDFPGEAEQNAIKSEITRCESLCDLSINQTLLMDRFLAEKSRDKINHYIYLYYRDIKRFLREKQIGCVFAEPTNANDLITYMICRESGIDFISPRDMRYPPKRLVFFEGFTQERILPRPGGRCDIDGKDLIDDFAGRRPTPYYFDRLNRMRVIHPGRIARSAANRLKTRGLISGRSLTHYSVRGRIRLTAGRALRSFYMRNICRYTDPDSLKGPLAFYGLHVQPENSIDVLGSYVSDQLKLIKDIRRALPFDTTLIVKEHPNFLGMKSLRFFRELKRIPNVKLIRHDVSTFDIYRLANLVLTVSGTAAYEAGLLGIPAVTFSPMYFGGLSSVIYCPDPSQLKDQARRLLNGFERRFDDDCAFMESLMRLSYDAYWTDPFFDRRVLNPDNVNKLTRAFSVIGNHDNS
jgi:hypothetical protein